MSKHDLLIEVGTEELPPKALLGLSQSFTKAIAAGLAQRNVSVGKVSSFAAPRRLAVLINAVDETTPDENLEQWGPPLKVAFDADGNPSKAGQAFAAKNGIDIDRLKECVKNDGKQDKLYYSQTISGSPIVDHIPGIIDDSLNALPIPKRMRWGASLEQFVRPLHWITAVFGSTTVAGSVKGLTIGNTTRGHRFHCSEELVIEQASNYESLLRERGKVIACFDTRRSIISEQVSAEGEKLGGVAVIGADLLDEVTALVEWPVALSGNFENRFLKVPSEALISSMKEHQKYFHVVDSNKELMPHFITVANIESSAPQKIIDGNERVIRPRLSDAAFFFETDCKTSLSARRDRLTKIVFQEKLGTVFDKTERITQLADVIAKAINCNADEARRAAQLCKSDLVSEMVLEFDDMQGIAGYYYALNDGESDSIALAMNEQYMPRFAGDQLPTNEVGVVLALADRLDTISGIFGIGQAPTGSKDPFALRRASLAVMRLIIEKNLDLNLRSLLTVALQQHHAVTFSEELLDTIQGYMFERLRAWYEDRGIATEVFLAVSAKNLPRPLDFDKRVRAVQAFTELDEAAALAAANKRVSNILSKSETAVTGTVDTALLQEAAEKKLAETLATLSEDVNALYAVGEYEQGLKSLAVLREPVDAFFDGVMVNADDVALKNNRLKLLLALQQLFLEVADVSMLVPAKK